jgi:hypothetical protein
MSKPTTLDRNIMELFTDSDGGNPEDKMRLFLIYYICSHSMSKVWPMFFNLTVVSVIKIRGLGLLN